MEKNSVGREIFEWILCIVIALVLAILVRFYVGTPTIVKQPSMYPTLKPDERLLLNRWSERVLNTPLERGDIVTFEAPSENFVKDADLNNPVAKYEKNINGVFNKFVYYVLEIGKTSYIKRVIGLPGDKVQIKDGKVYINDQELEEDYLQDNVETNSLDGNFIDIIVPEGCVFVMGDNRPNSVDSRRFGCIPLEKIESKVICRFWPFSRFGKIDK